MAWESSERRSGLPTNWNVIVKQVKERDGGRCTWKLPSGARCPRPGTDVDHRKPGEDHSMRNLQLLCGHHHNKKTGREAYGGRMAYKRGKKAMKRPPERHPGVN